MCFAWDVNLIHIDRARVSAQPHVGSTVGDAQAIVLRLVARSSHRLIARVKNGAAGYVTQCAAGERRSMLGQLPLHLQ